METEKEKKQRRTTDRLINILAIISATLASILLFFMGDDK